jgi:hypothetical protein
LDEVLDVFVIRSVCLDLRQSASNLRQTPATHRRGALKYIMLRVPKTSTPGGVERPVWILIHVAKLMYGVFFMYGVQSAASRSKVIFPYS